MNVSMWTCKGEWPLTLTGIFGSVGHPQCEEIWKVSDRMGQELGSAGQPLQYPLPPDPAIVIPLVHIPPFHKPALSVSSSNGESRAGAGEGAGRSRRRTGRPVWSALSLHTDTVWGGVTLSSAAVSGNSLAQAVWPRWPSLRPVGQTLAVAVCLL